MLQIETELAGRVYRNGAGRLFIADLRSPNAFLDMEVQRMRIVLSRAIVKHLPPRQRLVIVGRFLEGRPVEDVAAELGVGVKEIERLQSRAIERLRRVHELQVLAGVE
jgi:RNA polymerase sigma factor (sigma-70 family)